jgi:hypothetical protein
MRPLGVIKIPSAAERSVELHDGKPPVAGSFGKTDFSRVKQLLRL